MHQVYHITYPFVLVAFNLRGKGFLACRTFLFAMRGPPKLSLQYRFLGEGKQWRSFSLMGATPLSHQLISFYFIPVFLVVVFKARFVSSEIVMD